MLSTLLGAADPSLLFGLRRGVVRAGLAVLVLALVWAALTVALSRDRKRGDPWAKRLFGSATPEGLAAIRVVVVGIVIMMVLREDLPSTAHLPASMLDVAGKGFLSFFTPRTAYRAFLASAPALAGLRVGLLLALSLALAGYKTRVALPLSCVGYLVYGGILRQYTHFFHQGLLPLYLLAVLSMTPCADAWSVDRSFRERRGEPVPPADVPTPVYGQARWAVYAAMGLCYFAAGLTKLQVGGPLWWEPMNQRTKLLFFAVEARLGLSIGLWIGRLPDWFFAAVGIVTLLFELGMISVLWSKRARLLLAPILMCFHLGVVLCHQIVFPDLIVLPLILCQPQHLAKAVRSALAGRGEAARHLRAVLEDSGFSRSPAAAPEAAAAGTPAGRRPALLLYAIAAYLPCVLFMIEFYPLTSWNMLSDRVRTPTLTYMLVHERRADGSTHPMEAAERIGAMRDHRHYDVIEEHFDKGDELAKARVDEFFHAIARIHNARVPAEQRIVGFDVKRMRWDWGADLDDPGKSQVLQVYRLDLE
jgi:hypothetical protein